MCALFAATYPERTSALIMYGTYAKRIWAPDYPWAPTPEERQKWYDLIEQGWGGTVDLQTLAPGVADDEAFKEWWSAYLRGSASPGAALAFAKMNTQIDIRHILPAIRVPTLIIHRSGDLDADVGGSRFMAERISGAKYVELPGDDHLPWVGDQDAILHEVEAFLGDLMHAPELDRVLATVLVIATIGPNSPINQHRTDHWRDLLVRHSALIRREVDRFRGREIETTDDMSAATFDGPARALRAACVIRDAARRLGVEVSAGLHTGECEVTGNKIGGAAVEVGARVAAKAGRGEVLVSSTVKDLVSGSGVEFGDRGVHGLEGDIGAWHLFAVEKMGPAAK